MNLAWLKEIQDFNKKIDSAARESRFRLPTRRQMALAEINELHQAAYLREKKKRMLETQPDYWVCKLTLKLDRLAFPELTQSDAKLTPGKELARLLNEIRHDLSPEQFLALTQSTMGDKVTQKIMARVWGFDGDFLKDFGAALGRPPSHLEKAYRFMINQREKIETLRTQAQIWKLVSSRFPCLDRPSFYRTLRGVGLPMLQGSTPMPNESG